MDQKSGEFIKESVSEMSKNIFAEFVSLNLYPIAACTFDDSKLTCDGGDSEANATLHQACAFDALSPEKDGERDATQGIKYVACTMNPPKVDLEPCGDQIKDVKDKVEKCVSEQASIGEMMKNLKRFAVDYKPFVVIDEKQSKTQDQAAVKAWMLTICRALGANVPTECNSVPNFKRSDVAPSFRDDTTEDGTTAGAAKLITNILMSAFMLLGVGLVAQ
nr:uncharacterized protein LOC111415344 isoform X2 [Onthophagus taurus]